MSRLFTAVRNYTASSSAGFSNCGKTHNEPFRRAGFARGICFFLSLAKKSRSVTSLGTTRKHFFRSLFSLCILVLARSNPDRLKSASLHAQCKNFQPNFVKKCGLIVSMTLLFAAVSVASQQQSNSKLASAPAPKRDLSGLWHYEGTGASDPIAPDSLIPPMTPWAQARFNAEHPGYGPRRAPGGNDPILQCDPMGFPRIMFLNTPFEFVQVPGRVIQFFEHEHEYRTIWTDGRSLPKDPAPTWYGYAIGHWESDDTFVVDSSGFRDSTWLGSTGYPHSEGMRV